jgi:hypothetical protein
MTTTLYYLTRTASSLVELRQQRYRAQLEAGREHPHDVCAVARSKTEMRAMLARFRFGPVEWDSIEEDCHA